MHALPYQFVKVDDISAACKLGAFITSCSINRMVVLAALTIRAINALAANTRGQQPQIPEARS